MQESTSSSNDSAHWIQRSVQFFQSLGASHKAADTALYQPCYDALIQPCSERRKSPAHRYAQYAWGFLEGLSRLGAGILWGGGSIVIFVYRALAGILSGLWGGILALGERLSGRNRKTSLTQTPLRPLALTELSPANPSRIAEKRQEIITRLQSLAERMPKSQSGYSSEETTRLLLLDIVEAMKSNPNLTPASSLTEAFTREVTNPQDDDEVEADMDIPALTRHSGYRSQSQEIPSLFALLLNEVRKYSHAKHTASSRDQTLQEHYSSCISGLCEIAVAMIDCMDNSILLEPIVSSNPTAYDPSWSSAKLPLNLAIQVQSLTLVQALLRKGVSPLSRVETGTTGNCNTGYDYALGAIPVEGDLADPNQKVLAIQIAKEVFLQGVAASRSSLKATSSTTADLGDIKSPTSAQCKELRDIILSEDLSSRDPSELTRNFDDILMAIYTHLQDATFENSMKFAYLSEIAIVLTQQGTSLSQPLRRIESNSQQDTISQWASRCGTIKIQVFCQVLESIEHDPRPSSRLSGLSAK